MNNLLFMLLIKQHYSENICMYNEKQIQRLKKEPQENMHLILGDFQCIKWKEYTGNLPEAGKSKPQCDPISQTLGKIIQNNLQWYIQCLLGTVKECLSGCIINTLQSLCGCQQEEPAHVHPMCCRLHSLTHFISTQAFSSQSKGRLLIELEKNISSQYTNQRFMRVILHLTNIFPSPTRQSQ